MRVLERPTLLFEPEIIGDKQIRHELADLVIPKDYMCGNRAVTSTFVSRSLYQY